VCTQTRSRGQRSGARCSSRVSVLEPRPGFAVPRHRESLSAGPNHWFVGGRSGLSCPHHRGPSTRQFGSVGRAYHRTGRFRGTGMERRTGWCFSASAFGASTPRIDGGGLHREVDQSWVSRIVSTGLTDAAAARGEALDLTWSQRMSPLPPLIRIDHVLTGLGVVVTSIHTRPGSGSDHRDLLATVALLAPDLLAPKSVRSTDQGSSLGRTSRRTREPRRLSMSSTRRRLRY
jgi:hypothetical protein